MKPVTKTFKYDRALRDADGIPVGRAILLNDKNYTEGAPIPVALLLIMAGKTRNVLSYVFYIDGIAYRVPQDTPSGKVSLHDGMHKVNHVMLQQVNS
jgi:hypothetical protein